MSNFVNICKNPTLVLIFGIIIGSLIYFLINNTIDSKKDIVYYNINENSSLNPTTNPNTDITELFSTTEPVCTTNCKCEWVDDRSKCNNSQLCNDTIGCYRYCCNKNGYDCQGTCPANNIGSICTNSLNPKTNQYESNCDPNSSCVNGICELIQPIGNKCVNYKNRITNQNENNCKSNLCVNGICETNCGSATANCKWAANKTNCNDDTKCGLDGSYTYCCAKQSKCQGTCPVNNIGIYCDNHNDCDTKSCVKNRCVVKSTRKACKSIRDCIRDSSGKQCKKGFCV